MLRDVAVHPRCRGQDDLPRDMKKILLFSLLGAAVLLTVWFVAAPEAPYNLSKPSEAREDGGRGDRGEEADTAAQGLRNTADADIPPTAGPMAARADAGEIGVFLQRFKNTEVPLNVRQAEVEALGRTGDQQSWEVLRALAGERVYLSSAAVEALGGMKDARAKAQAGDYLAGLLRDSGGADSRDDVQITIAAVRGYAQLMAGEAAVPVLAQALERNKIRADGYQEMVGLEIVKALDETGSPQAAQVLLQELQRVKVSPFSLDYGSAMVRALEKNPSQESQEALREYAEYRGEREPAAPPSQGSQNRKKTDASSPIALSGDDKPQKINTKTQPNP
jgi:hypothetical protein